jgi:hypothetical protein
VTIDDKLAALAGRCEAPRFGPEGVCAACCFARRITTQIAAEAAGSAEGRVQATTAVCTYRQRLVLPLLELFEVSNPGLGRVRPEDTSEAEEVKRAFRDAPPEERQAFETLIESLYEKHLCD